MKSSYTVLISLFACLGTFLFGFDTGIVTTTIAHESFLAYMNHPSNAITGSVVSTYIAGEAIGSLTQTFLADRLGRLRFMQMHCLVVTLGCAIQTGAVNIGMFLAGRILSGIAIGALCGTVPVYLSEISPPRMRGFIGGLDAVSIAFGTMAANWVGYAGSFASYGPLQWRLPLALQLPWGVILLLGLLTFMPDSPRQLVQQGRLADARRVFDRICRADADMPVDEAQHEFDLMQAQIAFESQCQTPTLRDAWKLHRRRLMVCVSVEVLVSLTGINVVQYYQTLLYKSLGIGSTTILALTAAWGTCAFLSATISTFTLPDRWGRRKMLLTGVICIMLSEIYCAVLQHVFQNTDNHIGKGFAILGIYLFVLSFYIFIHPVNWIYGAEVLPVAIRNKGMGIASTAHYVVNVGITQAGTTAFANIGENYYYVFVGCCFIYIFIIYFYYPETKQLTLEDIAAAFGDRVVDEPEKIIQGLDPGNKQTPQVTTIVH